MSCGGVTIVQNTHPIQIIQTLEVINVCAQNPIAQFVPFAFVATQGQTVFTLSNVALAVWLAINGTMQNQNAGDFSVNENIVTLNTGIDAGDTVFGMIQVA